VSDAVQDEIDRTVAELRALGLSWPGVTLKSPWPGHLDLAVNDKTFAYLSLEGEPFGISCRLPHTAVDALLLPHTAPAAYGLGKWGWVQLKVPKGEEIPRARVLAWLDESYRTQAPKKLVKQRDAAG
jgi:predicted DNA-binding protein (MmcQ/YjbR family)